MMLYFARRLPSARIGLLLAPLACNGSSTGDGSAGSGLTTASASATETTSVTTGVSSTGASTSTSTDGDSGSAGSTTSSLKLDVGFGETETQGSTGEGMSGCTKIDFLFVVDNSASMSGEQDNLVASFDGFVATMMATLENVKDYHVMVVDSDAWVFSECEFECEVFENCDPNYDYECGVTEPLECEDILGAGVVHPRGAGTLGNACGFAEGQRYLESSDPDFVSKFECAAKVGIGSTKEPELMMNALTSAIAQVGEAATCNAGFLRDDAILVVTFITDEDDNEGDGSEGTPASWKSALVSAKNDDPEAIVMLGLFGHEGCAEQSPRLDEFAASFGDHGFTGSICADSYDAFFADAVSIIEGTCDDFMPPS